jgi:4-hydroxymandelate oxidase
VARGEDAGASALVLTVDLPVLGARDTDRRNSFALPDGMEYANLVGLDALADELPPARRVYNARVDPTVRWADLDWLRSVARVPVIVKGVLRPDDAVRAIDHGVDGLVVSNHGARNLDTVPATADALPRVAEAVDGRVPLLVDGGIRRGTDVAKALMLGATAVLVGRPYVWGLAAHGAEGVKLVVDLLRTELEMAMCLLGAPTLADLTDDLLWT